MNYTLWTCLVLFPVCLTFVRVTTEDSVTKEEEGKQHYDYFKSLSHRYVAERKWQQMAEVMD